MTDRRMRRRAWFVTAMVFALGACSSGGVPAATTTSSPTENSALAVPADLAVSSTAPFPAARCEANRAAGPMVFLTGWDFSASAASVEVVAARAAGYYAALCLDVDIRPSLAADNYALIAAGTAQMAAGGSFGELAEYAGRNEAQFKALSVDGRSVIDTLIVKPGVLGAGRPAPVASMEGKSIGVKGTSLSPALKAMMLSANLQVKRDYNVVPLDGFDPKVHIATADIAAFAGWQSNEPLRLAAAGIQFDTLDPDNYGIPGTFGVIYTNATFITEHPTAAVDFMRATIRGLHDAIAEPGAAVTEAFKLLDTNGNPYSLTREDELARWNDESRRITAGTTPALPIGVPDVTELTSVIEKYSKLGVYNGITPDAAGLIEPRLVGDLYDADHEVIWPASTA